MPRTTAPPSLRRGCAVIATAALLLASCQRGSGRSGQGQPSGQWPGSPPNGSPPNGWTPGSPSPGPAGPGATAPPGDAQRILEAHNRGRAEHCAAPLDWSPQIAATAQRWADRLAQRGCALEHSAGPLGENLAAGTLGRMSPERAVDMWLQERGSYDFPRGGFSMSTGHFTQVVWKETRRLGCGSAACSGMQVWVCNYDPPGNMEGGFQRNVGPASCRR